MEGDDLAKVLWVIAAVLLAGAEIVLPGFILLPFAIGAGGAAIAAFAGAAVGWQVAIFVATSLVAFLALRPLAKRLNDIDDPQGVGANRLLGERGVVLDRLGPDDPGLVRIDREQWRAESRDGHVLEVGARVQVVEVRGTRVIVVAEPSPPSGAGPATIEGAP